MVRVRVRVKVRIRVRVSVKVRASFSVCKSTSGLHCAPAPRYNAVGQVDKNLNTENELNLFNCFDTTLPCGRHRQTDSQTDDDS